MIDGSGGPVKRGIALEINDEDIASIKEVPSSAFKRKPDVDYSDCTIIPGLIDSHVHLAMSGDTDSEIRNKQLDATFEYLKEIIKGHIEMNLRYGIVAVRDGGDCGAYSLRYKKYHLNDPVILKTPGKAWHSYGRYGKLIGCCPYKDKSLSQSILADHNEIDHVKIINSGINSLSCYAKESEPQFTLEELMDTVSAADQLGLKTMIHANGKIPVELAVNAGCCSIEHGFFMGDENLRRMSERHVTWVPTLFTMEAYSRLFPKGSLKADIAKRNLENQLMQVSKAMEYGVTIASGTDSGSPGVYHGLALKEEMKLLYSAGLSMEETVKSATYNGAELLGMEKECGRLAAGMKATFVAIKGRPEVLFDSLEKPAAVWVKGKSMAHAIL